MARLKGILFNCVAQSLRVAFVARRELAYNHLQPTLAERRLQVVRMSNVLEDL